jgi:hypothetical protein
MRHLLEYERFSLYELGVYQPARMLPDATEALMYRGQKEFGGYVQTY